MALVKNLYHDEIRNGWLVKSDLKKIWNRQLEIWQEVDRICRRRKITYWAAYGTLLGAVRHNGFIPWDDDFDIYMMRPEFNRFSELIEDELKGSVFEIERKSFSLIKIAHSQTTLLARENINSQQPKGLVIDIFPLDVTLDGTRDSFFAVNAINELFGTVYNYPAVVEHVKKGGKTVNDWSVIEELHAFGDVRKQFEFLNIFAAGVFDYSSKVDWIERFARRQELAEQPKSFFRETTYFPFETVELPAPIGYDELLTIYFGDWHELIPDRRERLGFVHSTDIPYREFLRQVNLDFYKTNF